MSRWCPPRAGCTAGFATARRARAPPFPVQTEVRRQTTRTEPAFVYCTFKKPRTLLLRPNRCHALVHRAQGCTTPKVISTGATTRSTADERSRMGAIAYALQTHTMSPAKVPLGLAARAAKRRGTHKTQTSRALSRNILPYPLRSSTHADTPPHAHSPAERATHCFRMVAIRPDACHQSSS